MTDAVRRRYEQLADEVGDVDIAAVGRIYRS